MRESLAIGRYIETPTGRRIAAFVQKVILSRRCGRVVSPSGSGKTAFIENYTSQPDTYAKVITVLDTHANKIPLLKALGRAIGCNAVGQGSAAIYDKLEDFLSLDEFGEYHRDLCCDLLFFDEFQHTHFNTARVILELQKISGIPMVFFANEERWHNTRLSEPALKQIANRIPFRLSLEGIHSGDIQAFGVAYNVEGKAAYHYLEQFGLSSDLHEVRFILDEARAIAGPRGPITLTHLREAVALWRGEDRDRGLFKITPKPKREENAA